MLLAELFHVQSRRWEDIALKHVESLHVKLKAFIHALAKYVIEDEKISIEITDIVIQHLSEQLNKAINELTVLAEDERQQPITYNHYYTDNIQKARQADSQALISNVMNGAAEDDWNGALHISNNGADVQRLVKALQRRVIVDMDEQACAEARAGLSAYYKVC